MPNTHPVNDTRAVTDLMLARAAAVVGPKLHPIGAITQGLEGKRLTEMGELSEAGIIAVSDDGRSVTSSAVLRRALEYATNFGLLLIQHAEDHELTSGADMHEGAMSTRLGLRGWPRVAEDAIVARDLMLAGYVGARYHLAHVSTAGSVELVRAAKARGLAVSCEVTPHHLLLTDAALAGYDPLFKVNPPLREEADRRALLAALADGTIDSIATDHAPHDSLEKDCELSQARSGMMGLELCFSLMLGLVAGGAITLSRLIDALSTRPATILGLEPPRLGAGRPAELVLVDPEERWIPAEAPLKSKARNTPFLHQELTGRVLLTLAGGRLVFDRTEARS
jgi:dihydroorotase